jgi:oligoribonuclease
MDPSRCFVWFDTEYSELDIENASVLQAAVMITDEALRPLAPKGAPSLGPEERRTHGLSLWASLDPAVQLSEFVRTQTDLVDRCQRLGRPLAEVDRLLCEWIDAVLGAPASAPRSRPLLAGNSVHLDWRLAARQLPGLLRRVHYRLHDVTMLKTEWREHLGGAKFDKDDEATIAAWFPGAELVAGRHDAYYDVQASAAELAFYRAGLRPQQ